MPSEASVTAAITTTPLVKSACRRNEILCGNGNCIDSRRWCDGNVDCNNDETDCRELSKRNISYAHQPQMNVLLIEMNLTLNEYRMTVKYIYYYNINRIWFT